MQNPALNRAAFSVHNVARYLHWFKQSRGEELSPLKLQKSLYFLFAYYGAIYSKQEIEGEFEGTLESPLLFEAEFEAWKYGPVIKDVYFANKREDYEINNSEEMADIIKEIEKFPEAKKFIDEMFPQMDSFSDFSLVDRSHSDDSWKNAYNHENGNIMDPSIIIKEYEERYVR